MLKYEDTACWTRAKLIGPDSGKMAPILIEPALTPVETLLPGAEGAPGTEAPGAAADFWPAGPVAAVPDAPAAGAEPARAVEPAAADCDDVAAREPDAADPAAAGVPSEAD